MNKVLAGIIREWVDQNRKLFWKYEVSSFHRSFKINVRNLPKPAINDIAISPHVQAGNKMTVLCHAIEKACAKTAESDMLKVDVEIGFNDGEVTAELVSDRARY